MLFDDGLGYNALSTARSALSNVVFIPGLRSLADHPLVKRFLKCVFNMRPPNPRYVIIWDTNIVIKYLATLNNNNISFKDLTLKLTMLLALLAGQRVSTIHTFRSDAILCREKEVIFYIHELLKHDRPKFKKLPISYHAYPHEPQICPVTLIKQYLQVRNTLVPETEYMFFITHGTPHHGASKDTIARWIKEVMTTSGIDTSHFKPHSCRSASTSSASNAGISIANILKAGQWSKESTFYKFYKRNILWEDISKNDVFATTILSQTRK